MAFDLQDKRDVALEVMALGEWLFIPIQDISPCLGFFPLPASYTWNNNDDSEIEASVTQTKFTLGPKFPQARLLHLLFGTLNTQ